MRNNINELNIWLKKSNIKCVLSLSGNNFWFRILCILVNKFRRMIVDVVDSVQT